MNANKLDVKSILVSLSLALLGVTGFAACAAPVDSNEEGASAPNAVEEQVGEAQGATGGCCYGYYHCASPSNSWSWASGPRACATDGEMIPLLAHNACDAACPVACTNVNLGCD